MHRFDTTEYNRRFNWQLALGSIMLAASAFALVYVHTLFSLLVVPLAYLIACVACDIVSQLGLGRPFHPPSKFDTPTVTEFREVKDIINRIFDTPKYKDLTLAEGEEADRILDEDVPNLQTQALREGIELERTDAVQFIIERDAISEEVRAWL